jgi:hypothetical protein
VARGLVATDDALATIEANGTAVGFVDRRVKVTEGVEVGEDVTVVGREARGPDVGVLVEVPDDKVPDDKVVDDKVVADDALVMAWRA